MSFVPWNTYLLYCTYIKPEPKNKFAICVPADNKDLFFYINSNPRTIFNPLTQVKITTVEFPFLKYNSYINAADIINCVVGPTCKVEKEFGPIPIQVVTKIKEAVENSETLPYRFVQNILTG